MDKSPDIIRWVIDRMVEHDSRITADLALQVEREARAHWGGQAVGYIARRCAADQPDPDQVRQDYATARTVQDVANRHGINRRSVYKLLRKP